MGEVRIERIIGLPFVELRETPVPSSIHALLYATAVSLHPFFCSAASHA